MVNDSRTGDKRQPPGDRMMDVLRASSLTPMERIILAVLAYHDGPGGCYPAAATIADEAGIKRSSVFEYLNGLENKDVLVRQKWKSTNRYTIKYDCLTVRKFQTVKNKSDCQEIPDSDCQEIPDTNQKEPEEPEDTPVPPGNVVPIDIFKQGGRDSATEESPG